MTISRTGRVPEGRRHRYDRSDSGLLSRPFPNTLAQRYVIGLAIARLDEQIHRIVQLIGDTAIEHLSGHALPRRVLLAEDYRCDAGLAAAQALVNELDDVALRSQLSQACHQIRIDAPDAGSLLTRKPQALQILQPRQLVSTVPFVGERAVGRTQRRDKPVRSPGRLLRQSEVQSGEPVGPEVTFHTALDILRQARPQMPRRHLHRLGAQAIGDVLAIHDQIPTVRALASHEQVQVGVIGVVVRDTDPLQRCSQILAPPPRRAPSHWPSDPAPRPLRVR